MAYKQSPFPLVEGTSPVKQKAWLARQAMKHSKKVYTFAKRYLAKSKPKAKPPTKVANKSMDLKLMDTQTGKGPLGTKLKIETYQDIANPGKIHQIRYSDQGIKGGPWKIYPADAIKYNKVHKLSSDRYQMLKNLR